MKILFVYNGMKYDSNVVKFKLFYFRNSYILVNTVY